MNNLQFITAIADIKTTDYLIAVGVLIYVIKELLGIIKKNKSDGSDKKSDDSNNTSEILYRQSMMEQHEKMIIVLNNIAGIVKDTNSKCGHMETNLAIIKDRTAQKT